MAITKPQFPVSAYVGDSTLIQPCLGSRLYEDDHGGILLG
jgi:hypothetical protein